MKLIPGDIVFAEPAFYIDHYPPEGPDLIFPTAVRVIEFVDTDEADAIEVQLACGCMRWVWVEQIDTEATEILRPVEAVD